MRGLRPVRAISWLDGASRFRRKALTIRAMSLTNLAIACQAVYWCVIGATMILAAQTSDYARLRDARKDQKYIGVYIAL